MSEGWFKLRNIETGEVYPLGPMYDSNDIASTQRKLEAEHLPYLWELIDTRHAPVSSEETK